MSFEKYKSRPSLSSWIMRRYLKIKCINIQPYNYIYFLFSRLSCGIIARSAGLFQNSEKKICSCDGVTIWNERNVPLAGSGRKSKI